MANWNRVGDNIVAKNEKLEICGYWTICCQEDADHEVSIREGYLDENDVFTTEDGYFLLPLMWRYLDQNSKENMAKKNEFKPVGNKILIKRIKEEKKKGGLIILESSDDNFHRGVVIELGTGQYSNNGNLIPFLVVVGDNIRYLPFAGLELGDDLLIVEEYEIIGIEY